MNELDVLKYIGHRLPNIPHMSGIANRILKPIYNRKTRGLVVSSVLGYQMELDPKECVDGNLLFCPQLYDPDEVAFLSRHLAPDDTFVDVGANIGFYAFMAARKITKGTILAIEASPETYGRLQRHIELNRVPITAVNVGVSDKEEILTLSVNHNLNAGGQTFIGRKNTGVQVQCYTLLQITERFALQRIKMMKLDIEGYEYKVLNVFLQNARKPLYPHFIITEYLRNERERTTGDQIQLLKSHGYQVIWQNPRNTILKLVQI